MKSVRERAKDKAYLYLCNTAAASNAAILEPLLQVAPAEPPDAEILYRAPPGPGDTGTMLALANTGERSPQDCDTIGGATPPRESV